jgi:hypothetical protein
MPTQRLFLVLTVPGSGKDKSDQEGKSNPHPKDFLTFSGGEIPLQGNLQSRNTSTLLMAKVENHLQQTKGWRIQIPGRKE